MTVTRKYWLTIYHLAAATLLLAEVEAADGKYINTEKKKIEAYCSPTPPTL